MENAVKRGDIATKRHLYEEKSSDFVHHIVVPVCHHPRGVGNQNWLFLLININKWKNFYCCLELSLFV